MEFQPPPQPPPPDPSRQSLVIKVVVVWELLLSGLGLLGTVLLLSGYFIGWFGDWVLACAPSVLVVGLLLHIIFMLYRVISYVTALIFEVAPAMRNLSEVIKSLFRGRTD